MSKQYPDEATYNKLVRDRIPEIIEADGLVAETSNLSSGELINHLMDKIFEEAEELKLASAREREKELSNVLEILRSIAEESGIKWADVEKTMNKRAEKRGRFKRGIFLKRTYRKQ
jgi:predicted house-cleaning noncanonical NTP pyrophosphatase (MazG superfamily)